MQQRSEETHARLLEAATRLFSEQGYNASGVAEICAAAGVSKGAFYHHFASKQAVFLALLEEWLARLDAAFASVRLDASQVPQAVVGMADMAAAMETIGVMDTTLTGWGLARTLVTTPIPMLPTRMPAPHRW